MGILIAHVLRITILVTEVTIEPIAKNTLIHNVSRFDIHELSLESMNHPILCVWRDIVSKNNYSPGQFVIYTVWHVS